MKHVKVEYRTAPDAEPVVLFDGDVDEVQWSDGPGGFSVSGKMRKQSGGGAGGFLEKLAASRKAQTAEMVSEKREQLNNEAAVEHLASASAVSSAETG